MTWPPKPRAKEAAAVFALALALTLASAWPLLAHLGSALPSDLGDPILETWILWWNTQHVPLTTAWWNANMFVPLPGTFAMAETLLGLVPLTTPLQWAGLSPVVTHNIAFILSGPMAALSAYVLAMKITRRQDASILAALAFGFSPYRIAQISHMQVLWSCWMPFALAALHQFIESPDGKSRTRALVAFALCWMMNGFTNGYFLIYFPILVVLWLLWFARRWKDWVAVGISALIGSLPVVPMLIGYATHQQALGLSRQISEIRQFSADLSSIFAASPRAWLPSHWTLPPGPEGELYPGIAIVGLIIWGLIIAVRANPSVGPNFSSGSSRIRRTVIGLAILSAVLAMAVMVTGGSELSLGPLSISMHRPSRLLTVAFWLALGAFATSSLIKRAWASRSAFGFYVLAAAAMFFLALGPEPHAGATQILYKPPYAWLMYLPGFDSVRVPARFGLLMILCLTQAAALAWLKMRPGLFSSERSPSQPIAEQGVAEPIFARKRVPVYLLALAILAEGWIVMPIAMLPDRLVVPERARTAGTMIMELPIESEFDANTLSLLHAIDHKQPLINGFSGYMPSHYYALGVALKAGDSTALDAIREVGQIATFIDAARDKNGTVLTLVASAPGAELLETTERGSWYLLPKNAPPPTPVSTGQMLTISHVDATSHPEGAGPEKLIDGNTHTRWHGQINGEELEDTVTLTLERPAVIDVVEMDQGLWAGSYARDLEIVLVTEAGDVSVFRGPTGGLSVRAALEMKKDIAMLIPIRPEAPARAIKLISHPRGNKWTWSVGEVRLYGK